MYYNDEKKITKQKELTTKTAYVAVLHYRHHRRRDKGAYLMMFDDNNY